MSKLWVAGMASPNKKGRPKASVRTPQGMLLNWLRGRLSKKELNKLYDLLKPDKQADFICRVMERVIARPEPNSLTQDEIDSIFDRIEKKLDESKSKKAI